MAHCQWCGGSIVKSAGSVEHCEFVESPELFNREEDGAVIGCDEEALERIRRGELPWGMEEEDRSGHGKSKFPRFGVLVQYEYTWDGTVTKVIEEPFTGPEAYNLERENAAIAREAARKWDRDLDDDCSWG